MDFCLIVPDTHIPFEDLRAFALMLQVSRSFKIKLVVLLGDFLDFYGFSFYDKHPSFGDMAELYERELYCGRKRLDQLEALNAGKYIYLCGNHEDRLERFTTKNVPALRNRITVPTELGLSDKWLWVPYGPTQRYKIPKHNIYCRHDPPAGGGIDNIAKQSGDTVIFGHDHSIREAEFISKVSHQSHVAYGSGWLGDESQRVFKYVKRKPNWALAFRLLDEHGIVHLVRIKKVDGRYMCTFGDREFWG